MGEVIEENILIDYVNRDIFRKNHKLDHPTGMSAIVEYMVLDTSSICGISYIKICKSNLPASDNRFFAYIEMDGGNVIMSSVYPMFKVSNFLANFIGNNLTWTNIKI
jgi:hypothetical protein